MHDASCYFARFSAAVQTNAKERVNISNSSKLLRKYCIDMHTNHEAVNHESRIKNIPPMVIRLPNTNLDAEDLLSARTVAHPVLPCEKFPSVHCSNSTHYLYSFGGSLLNQLKVLEISLMLKLVRVNRFIMVPAIRHSFLPARQEVHFCTCKDL